MNEARAFNQESWARTRLCTSHTPARTVRSRGLRRFSSPAFFLPTPIRHPVLYQTMLYSQAQAATPKRHPAKGWVRAGVPPAEHRTPTAQLAHLCAGRAAPTAASPLS
jgi:hypothetical protein